ncbi:MAG: sulfite exporter TauE/SafE family protein [Candidatus Methanoperedens sp.]|nr:sulfite exporter TauE/SafE family protein [Candidatus Methanoperedens sp.]
MCGKWDVILLAFLILAAGLLYSSVGHGGASGYLAAMALFGLSPDVMKPTALLLNILVASVATAQFLRTGYFSWKIFWPFAITSIPFAFLGGTISLPTSTYKQAVGLILLFAAIRLFRSEHPEIRTTDKQISIPVAILLGAIIGLLSGSIGIGGGIFLSPFILLIGWAEPRQTAGVSAAFILVNSVAGLTGHLASIRFIPGDISYWGFAAVFGGLIGSHLGTRKFATLTLYRLLAMVLIIAGFKLLLF